MYRRWGRVEFLDESQTPSWFVYDIYGRPRDRKQRHMNHERESTVRQVVPAITLPCVDFVPLCLLVRLP
jgi:hypothetical protein